MADVTVVFGLDGGRPPVLVRNQCNLAKVASRAQNLHERIIPVLISHCDFALTLGNEEELIGELALADDDLLWIIHKQLHLGEENIDQLLVILEHRVVLDNDLEDELDDLVFQTRRDILDEQLQLLLILLTFLRELEEADNPGLEIQRQLDVLHGCIHLIELLLEGVLLSVQILDQHCHISQNVGIDDRTNSIREDDEKDLDVTDREGIVTRHEQYRVVDGHEVLAERGVIVKELVLRTDVKWSNPRLVLCHDGKPSAPRTMNVHDDEEHKLEKLQ